MIHKSILYTAIFGLLLASNGPVYADTSGIFESVVIHYGGTITIPPCTIETPTVNIDFGDIQAGNLVGTNDATPWKTFNLNLSDCTDVTTAEMTFLGPADGDYFANTGTAKNLMTELEYVPQALDTVPIYPGITMSPNINGQSSVSFPFRVRVRNDGAGAATTGTVITTITISYTFK